jgi:uncharacterized damage-inducible protein DinB
MNAQAMSARCDYFDMVHGVTRRAIGSFGDGDLEFRPTAAVRTPRELIFHIYSQEKVLAEAARAGRFDAEAAGRSNPEDAGARNELASLPTTSALKEYADACHQAAMAIFRAMSDEALARSVESPFGTFPAFAYFSFAYDEHWHHRGQLYTYLRLLGKHPPDLYGYGPSV